MVRYLEHSPRESQQNVLPSHLRQRQRLPRLPVEPVVRGEGNKATFRRGLGVRTNLQSFMEVRGGG